MILIQFLFHQGLGITLFKLKNFIPWPIQCRNLVSCLTMSPPVGEPHPKKIKLDDESTEIHSRLQKDREKVKSFVSLLLLIKKRLIKMLLIDVD